jgi:TIR domain
MAGEEGLGKSSGTGATPVNRVATVFISYASQDREIAKTVVENLEQHEVPCWIAPRDVTPGSQYAEEVVHAINDSSALILILSEHAIASLHVGREIERAASKRRRIMALRIDSTVLTRSFEYFLSESQWIDVAAVGMPAALTRLTQSVREYLSPSTWVSPGFGADVRNSADQKRRPRYSTIRRVVAATIFLGIAVVVVGVLTRYWPLKQTDSQPSVAGPSHKSIAVPPHLGISLKEEPR